MRSFVGSVGRFAVFGAALLMGACASLPAPVASPPTHALTDVAGTSLARIAAAASRDVPAQLSGFRLLPEAAFAFDARVALARRAEKALDVQYYVWQSDRSGLLLLRELRDAARRGVRVRLLLDDLYTGGQDELFAALALEPNVEVRLFNPLAVRDHGPLLRVALSLHEFTRINHRMHNKQFIADNTFSVTGGRNIADEYFMQSGAANFVDMDVLASGLVVRQQSDAFDRYWNSPHVRPVAQVVRA
ncbi:MAG: phospholipase D family protein, partial [Comamonadaceae bacterium]